MKASRFLAALLAFTLPLHAQKMQNAAGEAPGPWLLGTIGVGKGEDAKTPKTTALKGLAIKVGEKGEAAVAYDLDLCRVVGAWTGGKFVTPMNLMSRGEYPTALGEVAFTTGEMPGLIEGEAKQVWKDTRPEPFGPLPQGEARFRGFYVNGGKTILKWEIGGTEVLEMAEYHRRNNVSWFERTFHVSPHRSDLRIELGMQNPRGNNSSKVSLMPTTERIWISAVDNAIMVDGRVRVIGFAEVTSRERGNDLPEEIRPSGQLDAYSGYCTFPASASPSEFRITVWEGKAEELEALQRARDGDLGDARAVPDLRALISAVPAGSPPSVSTTGELAKSEQSTGAAYVVDTIKLPDPNPWGAPMFTSGFDFFDDGRAAVCTFHGDVFLVSGIDEKLEKVTWRRFATGLYHPLGLKIVKGEVYVTCRDGIWRLKDLNADGEADFYEAFNFDIKVTKNFHEFVFDLQTDPAGNFYFAKAGPVKNGGRGFDQIMAHHGTLMRVSPDGAKLDVIATGFRAPNGIGVGPRGELTSGDNEGTWTPACKINWIKPGGFYGVVDLAHRPVPPTDYDRPLCWLPKRIDNSGGGQVWVPEGDRWGPWGGHMLHLSYGQSALYGVLKEEVDVAGTALMQGGVTKFPLQFQSGMMRGRFNPKDGQLYVMGLRGWQTNGLKNGCFQRVRYTGAVPRMPVELNARKDGIALRFACSLDTQTARDPQNWNIEKWRYVWSAAYGSPELSTEEAGEKPGDVGKDGRAEFTKAQAGEKKHDPVPVKSVTIGTDDRSVFLEIPGLRPAMQMAITYDLKASDGQELRGEVVHTVHGFSTE
jgi:hypothetical protein